jgi:hypothetical protein
MASFEVEVQGLGKKKSLLQLGYLNGGTDEVTMYNEAYGEKTFMYSSFEQVTNAKPGDRYNLVHMILRKEHNGSFVLVAIGFKPGVVTAAELDAKLKYPKCKGSAVRAKDFASDVLVASIDPGAEQRLLAQLEYTTFNDAICTSIAPASSAVSNGK